MHQAAALPYRRGHVGAGAVEVLLVNSSSNRWIIPKGDIDGGMEPHRAAEKEAFEEGGVRGQIGEQCLGEFRARKEENGAITDIEVAVFPLEVTEMLDSWPEVDHRKRRWLSLQDAAEAVADPGLAEIIRRFKE